MQCKDIPDDVAIQAARDALAARFRPNTLELLVERTGAPRKVAWKKLERLEQRGYLEYGTSLRCCWPTGKVDSGRETA